MKQKVNMVKGSVQEGEKVILQCQKQLKKVIQSNELQSIFMKVSLYNAVTQ